MTLDAFLQQFGSELSAGPLLALGVAVLGGVVASAICPCTLPIGAGVAGFVAEQESESRRRGFLVATAFFAGIVVNLAILGAVAGRLGVVLTEAFGRYWALAMALVSVAAAVLAFYGPRLRTETLAALRKPGVLGAFGYGFIFSLGTSAAPLLLLLAIAAAQAEPRNGLALAVAFGIGRGLPFLIVGVFAGAIVRFAQLGRWRRAIQFVSGFALLLVGVYYARVFVTLTS